MCACVSERERERGRWRGAVNCPFMTQKVYSFMGGMFRKMGRL